MAWRRIDDAFDVHPKVEALRDLGARRFTAAIAVWTLAGCHGVRGDGTFTGRQVIRMGVASGSRAVLDLISVGLVADLGEDTYRFHDWEDYNEGEDEKAAKRQVNAERQRRYRLKRAEESNALRNADVPHAGAPAPRPVPSRPVPSQGVQGSGQVSSQTGAGGSASPPEQGTLGIVQRDVKPEKKPRKAKPPTVTGETWLAYSAAYEQRYSSSPVRNASVNGQLAHFVRRVGAEEAPAIAGFYVEHNAAWYVTKGHPVSALLADAEKLRTEWATGRRITSGDAKEAEVFDEMRAKSRRVDRIIAELDAAEGKP